MYLQALTKFRYTTVKDLYRDENRILALCFFVAWNLFLSMLACLPVVFYTQGAKGSGIPECKAYLNGVNMSYFLRPLFIQKCMLSPGYSLGPRRVKRLVFHNTNSDEKAEKMSSLEMGQDASRNGPGHHRASWSVLEGAGMSR